MDNYNEIKFLAELIEKQVGLLLEEIENQKKVILAKAKQDALMEIHNAKKVSQEIIESTIRQTQQHLNAIQNQNAYDAIPASIQELEEQLKEINEINELQLIEKLSS